MMQLDMHLDPAPLMLPGVRNVLAILPEARFAGGCVRDLLLGRPIADIDMASPVPPETVMKRAEAAGIKAIPTGIAHGTVTLAVNGRTVEVTALRQDVATDGRHATVAFTDSWKADAARRDFTINAMSLDADGTLHDYFDGVTDLKAGRLRFIGDPAARIGEDALRILRFYRFAAQLGIKEMDREGHAACMAQRDLLSILSTERVRDELLKLLAAPDPEPALKWMEEGGILAALHPEARLTEALEQLVVMEKAVSRPDAHRRLYRLAGSCGKAFRLPAVQIERMKAMAGPDAGEIAPALYRLGRVTVEDRMILNAVDTEILKSRLAALSATPDPVFPVRAADLMARGYVPGPELGLKLKELEERWLASGCHLDRATLLEALS